MPPVSDMQRFEGKVALITGGGSGLGRASGVRIASEGGSASIADIDPEGGRESCRLVEAAGGKALFVEADVTRAEDNERMVAETVREFGRLDVLFTSAGVGAGGTAKSASRHASLPCQRGPGDVSGHVLGWAWNPGTAAINGATDSTSHNSSRGRGVLRCL